MFKGRAGPGFSPKKSPVRPEPGQQDVDWKNKIYRVVEKKSQILLM
jgi:hypothetical protein